MGLTLSRGCPRGFWVLLVGTLLSLSSVWVGLLRVPSPILSWPLRLSGASWGPGILSSWPVQLVPPGTNLNFSNLLAGLCGSLGQQLRRAASAIPRLPWAGRGGGGLAQHPALEWGILSLQNDVEKVVVVILDKEHRPVEKFVFEITQPPLLSIR